jgi:hypothetical protein
VDRGVRELNDHALERELAVVAALRRAGAVAGPRPDEVDRIRQRVMAGLAAGGAADGENAAVTNPGAEPAHAGRVAEESGSRVALFAPGGSVTPGTSARRHRGRHRASVGVEARNRTVVAAASLCLFLSLSGTSLLLSQDALPGDALYRVKRSVESAELGMTFGEESRAFKHLEFATARVDEIEALAAEVGTTGGTTARFLDLLDDFDADAAAGSRLFTSTAADGDQDVLPALLGWVSQQQERLGELRAALPPEASSRLSGSLDLLARVQDRVEALDQRAGCENVASEVSDDLGPLPDDDPCARRPLDEATSAISLPEVPGIAGAPVGSAPAAPATPVPGEQLPAEELEGEANPGPPRLSDLLRPPDPSEGAPLPEDGIPTPPPRLVLPPMLLPDVSLPPLLGEAGLGGR